jgi:hypothetical protein
MSRPTEPWWDPYTSSYPPTAQARVDQLTEDFAEFVPWMVDTLREGLSTARAFFALQRAPIDAALGSYLVRWSVLRTIRAEQATWDWPFVEDLGLSGISFAYRTYHWRVWKADDLRPGTLASTPTREAFWAQQLMYPWGTATDRPHTNLVWLWDVDAQWTLASVRIGPPQMRQDQVGFAWSLAVRLDRSPT